MKRSIVYSLLLIIMVASSCNFIYANAGPVIVEEGPVFTVIPAGSTEVGVEEELLIFDFREGSPYSVNIKAVYKMVNGTDATINQKMMFPLITAPNSGFLDSISISVEGEPVEFETLRLQDYTGSEYGPLQDNYYDDYITRAKVLDMNKLLSAWNDTSKSSYFNPDDEIQLITFTAPRQKERYEMKVDYQIEPDVSKLIAIGFPFHSWNNKKSGSFGKWIEDTENEWDEQNPVLYVLGKPINEDQLKLSPSVSYHTETIVGRELLGEWVDDRIPLEPSKNREAYYDYVAKKIDFFLGSDDRVAHLDSEILEPYFYHSYVGALIYDVEFSRDSVREVMVEYTAEASQDRTETSRYSALVAYLLNPAKEWKNFQNLTIHIYPHREQPYILDSSLDMEKQYDGTYSAYYETLPNENLIFRMYHRDTPESGLLKTLNNPYVLLLAVPVVLVLAVLGVVTMVVFSALKKNHMNFKE